MNYGNKRIKEHIFQRNKSGRGLEVKFGPWGSKLFMMPIEALESNVARLKDGALFANWSGPGFLKEEIMEWWQQNFKH